MLVEFAAVKGDPTASWARLDGTGIVSATGSAGGSSVTTVAVRVESHDLADSTAGRGPRRFLLILHIITRTHGHSERKS